MTETCKYNTDPVLSQIYNLNYEITLHSATGVGTSKGSVGARAAGTGAAGAGGGGKTGSPSSAIVI